MNSDNTTKKRRLGNPAPKGNSYRKDSVSVDEKLDKTIYFQCTQQMKTQLAKCADLEKIKQSQILRNVAQNEIDRIFQKHNMAWKNEQ